MKSCLLFVSWYFFFLFVHSGYQLHAQELKGTWQGRLNFMGNDMRIVFHFKNENNNLFSGTMDSPDQGGKNIKVEEVELNQDSLSLDIPSIEAEYFGIYNKDSAAFFGHVKQHGLTLALRLIKGESEDLLYKRPQKPLRPFQYHDEEVSILNKHDHDTLAGTFAKPNGAGKFPVVILITGSGAEDRDETVFAHKPFLVISDYLVRRGFAVMRCDDRGTAKSTGDFASATTDDFARDVEAQIDYLKTRSDVDQKRMGLIGHSEGGIIAPMVAAKRKDVAFIVMLAGPSIDMFDLLLAQDSLTAKADGMSESQIQKYIGTNKKLFELARAAKDSATAADSIDNFLSQEKKSDKIILTYIRQLCSKWMRWYIGFDPRENLSKLRCAVLALNGEKDVQVPAFLNIPVIDEVLRKSGNKNYKTEILPGLNHLFQLCKKCSVSEYVYIEQTMDTLALSTMGDWLEKNFLLKKKR